MVNGAEEIGMRGSICASVFIVSAGAPGGVNAPCPKGANGKNKNAETMVVRRSLVFIILVFINQNELTLCVALTPGLPMPWQELAMKAVSPMPVVLVA